MRTTLSLDDDVLDRARLIAAKLRKPFRFVINAALRQAGGLVVWIVSTYGPDEEDRWPIMYDHVFGEEQGKPPCGTSRP